MADPTLYSPLAIPLASYSDQDFEGVELFLLRSGKLRVGVEIDGRGTPRPRAILFLILPCCGFIPSLERGHRGGGCLSHPELDARAQVTICLSSARFRPADRVVLEEWARLSGCDVLELPLACAALEEAFAAVLWSHPGSASIRLPVSFALDLLAIRGRE